MTVSGNFVGSAFWEYRPLVMAQAVSTRGPVTGTATGRKKRRKPFLLDLYSTAVGKKYAMALSGIALMGYVLAHMIGNLKMFLGPADLDHYAEFLRELLVPIAAANRRAVDPAHRPDRCGRAAHPRRVQPDRDQPPGAVGQVPERARLPGGQLRQPHHALDGNHRAAVRAVAPRRLHVGMGQSRLRARRRLSQRRCHRCRGYRSRSCTSSPTLRSASTSTTGHGACFSRWAGTDRGSTSGGVVSRLALPR